MSDPGLPFRIVYHPAPGPTPDGKVSAPEPIALPRDMVVSVRWMKRRLGMPLEAPLPRPLFSREPLELGGEPDAGVRFVRDTPRESTLGRLGIRLPSLPLPGFLSGRDALPPGLKPTTARPTVREERQPDDGEGVVAPAAPAEQLGAEMVRTPLTFIDPYNQLEQDGAEPSDADPAAAADSDEPSDEDLRAAADR
jgi:hypothetical protein